MNEVRERVGLPAVYPTEGEFFDRYRNERKVELAFEGHLFWDMRRWRLAHIEYNNYRCHGMKITGSVYEYVDCDGADRWFAEKLYVLPVPPEELKNNRSGIKQYDEWL